MQRKKPYKIWLLQRMTSRGMVRVRVSSEKKAKEYQNIGYVVEYVRVVE